MKIIEPIIETNKIVIDGKEYEGKIIDKRFRNFIQSKTKKESLIIFESKSITIKEKNLKKNIFFDIIYYKEKTKEKKMNTVYTVPKLHSLGVNMIKDIFSVASYLPQLRLIQLDGVPVRIELNKSGYIEINSEEEEIDLSAYNKIFENLLKFFYGTAYLYGFVDNNKLLIYDVYTNENFFSTRDLFLLETKFNLPIVKPIAEGNFTFNYLIEVLNKKINGEKLKWDTFYLLPSVYVADNRTFVKQEENVISKVIFGEKKAVTTYYNNNFQTATTTETKIIKPKKTDIIFNKIFKRTLKSERQQIYKETLSNIENYAKKIKNSLTEEQKEWFSKNGKFFTYLYSMFILPSTRDIVYDFCYMYILELSKVSKPIEEKWSCLFLDMFQEEFSNLLEVKKIKINSTTIDMFALFFKEELLEFDKFFVKETDKEYDWRYCINYNFYYGDY